MGWCNGSEISIDVWDIVREYIPKDKRKELATEMLDLFTGYDADWYCGDSNLEMDAEDYWGEEEEEEEDPDEF
jgi:hypothetical protein